MTELAEGARLEIVCAPKEYLGFESLSLRQITPAPPEARFIRGFAPIIRGRVAERLNAAVSKTVSPATPVTRVQIPALPPVNSKPSRLRREGFS